jgi:hypothetical protein
VKPTQALVRNCGNQSLRCQWAPFFQDPGSPLAAIAW